jgi:hypothetical protein
VKQLLADAAITPERMVQRRMSLPRRMARFGVQFISGADAGIAPTKAHGGYAEAVIDWTLRVGRYTVNQHTAVDFSGVGNCVVAPSVKAG